MEEILCWNDISDKEKKLNYGKEIAFNPRTRGVF